MRIENWDFWNLKNSPIAGSIRSLENGGKRRCYLNQQITNYVNVDVAEKSKFPKPGDKEWGTGGSEV